MTYTNVVKDTLIGSAIGAVIALVFNSVVYLITRRVSRFSRALFFFSTNIYSHIFQHV